MADVVWSDAALRELIEIPTYIGTFDPGAADRIVSRLLKLGDSLADFPNRGRPVPNDMRELTTIPPYVLRYRVTADTVSIARIRHGARRSAD